MKTVLFGVSAILLALLVGFFVGRSWDGPATAPAMGESAEREILYYKAPMDPNYRRDKPGKSPMGMDLVPVYADESTEHAGMVHISPTVINNLGVRTTPVQKGPLSREIQTVGYIGYNEDTLNIISTRVDGWIDQLAVAAKGDRVIKGQTLLELYSPALVNAQQEYLASLQSKNSAMQRASRERLVALGVGDIEVERLTRERTVAQHISIKARESGVVTHLGVREGQFVTPGTHVMSIGSLDTLWLHAEILERYASWVAEGQSAQIRIETLPGVVLNGQVNYVYPEVDPKTRTLDARIVLENSTGVLSPNMFARATIQIEDRLSVLHVPVEAVIRGGAIDRVVIAAEGGGFVSRPVTLGIQSSDRVEITSGLSVGDQVVTSGQFLIDSESNVESAMERMRPEKTKTFHLEHQP